MSEEPRGRTLTNLQGMLRTFQKSLPLVSSNDKDVNFTAEAWLKSLGNTRKHSDKSDQKWKRKGRKMKMKNTENGKPR